MIRLCEIAWKFIHGNQCVEKFLIGVFRQLFCGKVPFWWPYWPWNYFSHAILNLSRQGASFKYPYTYIPIYQKMEKFVGIEIFCHQCLSCSFLHWLSYAHFFYLMNNKDVISFRSLFWVFVMKLYMWPLPWKNWKNWTCDKLIYFKKKSAKMSSFSTKFKKPSKSCIFLGDPYG